jgi:hypothetical protein
VATDHGADQRLIRAWPLRRPGIAGGGSDDHLADGAAGEGHRDLSDRSIRIARGEITDESRSGNTK